MIKITDAAERAGVKRVTLKLWVMNGLIPGAVKMYGIWLLPDNWKVPKTKRGPRFMKDRK